MNFIITLVLLMLILCLIVSVHEFGHFIAAKKSKVYVDEFSIGMGPLIKDFKRKKSETTLSLRALPIGGYVSMAEKEDPESKIKKNRVLENKGFFTKFWVFINGIVFNFILAFVLFFVMGLIVGREVSDSKVTMVDKNYPAYTSGIEVGDEILKVNGVDVDDYYDFSVEVNAKELKDSYKILVKKTDGSTKEYEMVPVIEEIDGEEYRRFGIGFTNRYEKGFLNALIYSFEGTYDTTAKIFDILVMLFKGDLSMDSLSGPVGMYSIVDTVKGQGIANILYIIAYLSINVAIINLLPIPVFDGGRILIIVIEKIIRKKSSEKLENILNYVGFGLMILLMIFVTFNDIIRLVVK